jgi:nucleotide-binding universal stress UspA family protein
MTRPISSHLLWACETPVVDGRQSAFNFLRERAAPVVVAPNGVEKPETVVVGVDFGQASERAARIAIDMLDGDGTVYLVYVDRPFDVLPDGIIAAEPDETAADISSRFATLDHNLRRPENVNIETIVLNGSPVPALLEFADRVGADMLAVGTHGLKGLQRLLLGSVSAELIRRATMPVIVAPAAS